MLSNMFENIGVLCVVFLFEMFLVGTINGLDKDRKVGDKVDWKEIMIGIINAIIISVICAIFRK